jgi:hypothetical protein
VASSGMLARSGSLMVAIMRHPELSESDDVSEVDVVTGVASCDHVGQGARIVEHRMLVS